MQLNIPIEQAIAIIDKLADEGQRGFDQMEFDYLEKRDQKTYDPKEDNKKYSEIYLNSWYRECLRHLENIFLEKTPIQEFRRPKTFALYGSHGMNEDFINIGSNFATRIAILQKFYWALTERLNQNKGSQSKNTKSVKPRVKLPPGTKWEDLTLKFLNGETVEIYIRNKGKLGEANYHDFGLENKRERMRPPTQPWNLFKILSKHPDLKSKDIDAPPHLRRTKCDLKEAFQLYFGISEDPFFEHKIFKAYKLKFRVIPENEPFKPVVDDFEAHYSEITGQR
ncbi:hypothetical protein HN709_03860 [Candidatus Peregrinibacteria bacterium]|jgi:hypothetical protein|nr:hypothetical protein [Candidatus Peregrinibacteria bacterium]MBT7736801.1 hypothetical protein [Candidatus Peregrinibacteria bacterium]